VIPAALTGWRSRSPGEERSGDHPAVDRIADSRLRNLEQLRPSAAGKTEIRILLHLHPSAGPCCFWR